MRRSERVTALRAIVEIRAIQQASAEMRVAQADAVLREVRADHDKAVSAVAAHQANWRSAVTGASLSLPLAHAWGAAVERAQTDLRRLEQEISVRQGQRDQFADAWRAARARTDAAKDLARSAAQQLGRSREKAAQADLDDRAALGDVLR